MSSVFGGLNTGNNADLVTLDTDQIITGKKRFLNDLSEMEGTLVQPTILAEDETIDTLELSYLAGTTSNIQTQFSSINSGLTTLNQALQALDPAPDATTVRFNNKLEVTNGTTTMTVNQDGITTRNTSANLTHYLNFSDSASTGTGAVQKTAGLSCNPSSNTITAANFAGTATNASNVTLAATATGNPYYIVMSATQSGNSALLTDDSGATYNSGNNTITANITGSAALAVITQDNTDGTYYIPFVKTSGAGNKALNIDDTTGPLSYNPNTATLSTSAATFSGSVTTNGGIVGPTTALTYTSDMIGFTGKRLGTGGNLDITTGTEYSINLSTEGVALSRGVWMITMYSNYQPLASGVVSFVVTALSTSHTSNSGGIPAAAFQGSSTIPAPGTGITLRVSGAITLPLVVTDASTSYWMRVNVTHSLTNTNFKLLTTQSYFTYTRIA